MRNLEYKSSAVPSESYLEAVAVRVEASVKRRVGHVLVLRKSKSTGCSSTGSCL